ncbi:hypothetical protein Goshw_019852 [Gossypium schwendimanii]|uniref:DUF4005 domain-containing protein n=1 Tax=Gossypium schwendimanii TaxID=34291 RepID=A0A7J9LGX7_GOSSC|nr:hypothetical protein [Gossypium schwendimanii]
MGKKGKWLSSLKKVFSPDSQEKKNQKSKQQLLEKQVHLGSNDSGAATLETVNLSPPPPEEVKPIEAESKQTYPVVVATTAASPQAAVDVVQRQLNRDALFAGKSEEEVAAIKIQTAFRNGILSSLTSTYDSCRFLAAKYFLLMVRKDKNDKKARRALHALKGLVRLKSLMAGPVVKRQAASTLRCMQTLSRLQCQVRIRRTRMTEENQALQRQLLQKHAKEIVNLQMGEDWDDSLQSKEQIEASLLSKHEAAMRRERAMAYSFTHQQTWKNASRSMNPLFMDPKNPSWGWSWLERWMAAQPQEGRGTTEKEQNDQSSIRSARSNFGGEISKAYARYQLNLDKQSPKAGQKPNQTSSLLSVSTPKTSASIPARKLKSASPRSSVVGPDDDGRSMVSIQSERNRRHSIAGSLVHDNEGLGSSPLLPSYMVPTESTRAKTKLQSPLGLEANGTPRKGPIASAKKRLSYPPSPARPRQHLLIQKLVS